MTNRCKTDTRNTITRCVFFNGRNQIAVNKTFKLDFEDKFKLQNSTDYFYKNKTAFEKSSSYLALLILQIIMKKTSDLYFKRKPLDTLIFLLPSTFYSGSTNFERNTRTDTFLVHFISYVRELLLT